MWGRFEHSLDDKGRMIVPQKFREPLGAKFILTVGPGRHIRAYPVSVWEAMEEEIYSEDPKDELKAELSYLQRMFGNSEEVSIDTQFRLTISRFLREWAGIQEGEPAIVIGSGNRLEIWSRTQWSKELDVFSAQNADAAIFGDAPFTPGSSLPPSPAGG